ncbi:MAG: GNAT family N-acetyltransferase [Rhodocyclaceae bacterium]|nr:GNAT family N-acetyltransferase [Rhodocyclaceae bacterium]
MLDKSSSSFTATLPFANAKADTSITGSRYRVSYARTPSDVLAAQRLRYKVFAEELGAHLDTRVAEHDIDHYDASCEHLIVREICSDKVIGTYRILPPAAAKRIGNYYSDNEFFLNRLHHLSPRMVEVGRSCIHQDHRNGAVIALLWAGLAEYMTRNNYDYLIGCASIGMADGGHNAANVFQQLDLAAIAPIEYHAFPQHRLPHEALSNDQPALVPPLINGYLRLGAWVCGEPAWDPDFNTADLLILLPMARMNTRYLRHFVKNA